MKKQGLGRTEALESGLYFGGHCRDRVAVGTRQAILFEYIDTIVSCTSISTRSSRRSWFNSTFAVVMQNVCHFG